MINTRVTMINTRVRHLSFSLSFISKVQKSTWLLNSANSFSASSEIQKLSNENKIPSLNLNLGYMFNGSNFPVVWTTASKLFSHDTKRNELDLVAYAKIADETLESLSDHFDEVCPPNADISNADGVLTAKLGEQHGTYVINKQLPNKQIWFSSPVSGPKRYDFYNDGWYYKYQKLSLHALLDEELSQIFGVECKFHKCSFGTKVENINYLVHK